jgi:uncharacterized protein
MGNAVKDLVNQVKHGVSFEAAQRAFDDPLCLIFRGREHEKGEKRFYCLGKVDDKILTVRFSYRRRRIRIFGAGYWRKGKKRYEEKNHLHG